MNNQLIELQEKYKNLEEENKQLKKGLENIKKDFHLYFVSKYQYDQLLNLYNYYLRGI